MTAGRVRLARGRNASELHAAVITRMAERHGLGTIVVDAAADHEVYLQEPAVHADVDWSR